MRQHLVVLGTGAVIVSYEVSTVAPLPTRLWEALVHLQLTLITIVTQHTLTSVVSGVYNLVRGACTFNFNF